MTDDNEKIGLFDMDNSLADFEGSMWFYLEKLRSPDEPVITDLWDAEDQPHIKERMRLIKNLPGWWANLPVMFDGLKMFLYAKSLGFECQVCTKGPSHVSAAWKEKVDWVHTHLDDSKNIVIHITGDKSKVYGQFLYDDYPDYLTSWLTKRPRGIGIMPVNQSNKDFVHPRVVKYDPNHILHPTDTNLEQVCRVLKKIYKRQPNELIDINTKED